MRPKGKHSLGFPGADGCLRTCVTTLPLSIIIFDQILEEQVGSEFVRTLHRIRELMRERRARLTRIRQPARRFH